MRRREFVTLLAGAAAWPFAARAQQPQLVRRVAVLHNLRADDPAGRSSVNAFTGRMQELGWNDRNLRGDYRLVAGDVSLMQSGAADLVNLRPDVIFAGGSAGLAAAQQVTRTIPIVFVNVADPVGQGFVASLAHPGSNATGFTNFEFTMGGKWLQLLKDIVPSAERIALVMNPGNPGSAVFLRSIEAAAPSFGVVTMVTPVRNQAEIEDAMNSLASSTVRAAVILPDGLFIVHRQLVIHLAARHRMSVIYPFRDIAVDGGLVSYGIKVSENFRQAADYVDRILRGALPADLPVQAPTKYELVINLKTAKTLGLTVPPLLLATADEVIE